MFKEKYLTILISSIVFFYGCGKDTSPRLNDHGEISAEKNKAFFERVGDVYAVNFGATYSQKLKECIYVNMPESSCAITDAPLIGMEKKEITVSSILNRTFVSHDFLRESFQEVLKRLDPRILNLFGSVNAIVISDKINPSFYYSVTGAIYLSGRYFWRNIEEYKIVSKAEDPRSMYGKAKGSQSENSSLFAFEFDAFYAKNQRELGTREHNNFRNYNELVPVVSRILFHELTHAQDYFPRTFYESLKLKDSDSYYSVAYEQYSNSRNLSALMPSFVKSQQLMKINDVIYFGEEANNDLLNLSANVVKEEFKNDVATDLYSYSNNREDLAMLAEESLMFYFYDYYRYIGIITYPHSNFEYSEQYDFPIVFGQKGRFLSPLIRERSMYLVENIFDTNFLNVFSNKIQTEKAVDADLNSIKWDNLIKL